MSMFERVKSQLLHRHYTKKKEAIRKGEGNITPKIRIKLRKNTELSNYCEVTASGAGVFAVESYGRDYVVELNKRACSCRRWQLTGIPCSHAIACMKGDRLKPENMVSSCFSLSTYIQAYGQQIFPSVDKDEWEDVNAPPILPPLYEKYSGRRKKIEESIQRRVLMALDLAGMGLECTVGIADKQDIAEVDVLNTGKQF